MGCSQPKLSRTGLRNILAFLKVKLQHFLGGTRALLRLPVARGLMNDVVDAGAAMIGSVALLAQRNA